MTHRVGIVGLGLIGRERLSALEELVDRGSQIEIVGVVDPYAPPDLVPETRLSSISELISLQPDLVIVATPHDIAVPISEELLWDGADVLLEKPLGRSAAEADRLARSARASGRTLHVGMNYRFFAGVRALLEDVRRGRFGELVSCRMTLGHGGSPGDETTWKLDPVRAGGGCLIDPGIHLFDLASLIAGDVSVTYANQWSGFWSTGIEEACHVELRSSTVELIHLDISVVRWRSAFSIEVVGTDGYGVVSGRGRSYGPQRYVRGQRWGWQSGRSQADSEEQVSVSDGSESFRAELEMILGDVEPKDNCSLVQGLAAMTALEQARSFVSSSPSRGTG